MYVYLYIGIYIYTIYLDHITAADQNENRLEKENKNKLYNFMHTIMCVIYQYIYVYICTYLL